MSTAKAIELVTERFGKRIVESADLQLAAKKTPFRDGFIRVAAADLVELSTFLRDDDRLQFDLLHSLTAVDYLKEGKIELIYSLDSTSLNHILAVRVFLDRDDAVCPTLENVWRTADWHERESWDLMGVTFTGHHNLVRILCAEDWEGHPLRKDYVMPSYYHGIPNDYEMFYDTQNK